MLSAVNDALDDTPPTSIIAGTLAAAAGAWVVGSFLSDPAGASPATMPLALLRSLARSSIDGYDW